MQSPNNIIHDNGDIRKQHVARAVRFFMEKYRQRRRGRSDRRRREPRHLQRAP
jgi:hypothetical protein